MLQLVWSEHPDLLNEHNLLSPNSQSINPPPTQTDWVAEVVMADHLAKVYQVTGGLYGEDRGDFM